LLLSSSAWILKLLGYTAIINEFNILTAGHGLVKVVYSCLGLGVISFFAAFVLSYPQKLKSKIIFLIAGILAIEALNIIRFVLLALYGKQNDPGILDHHTIFNIIMYLVIAFSLYFWIRLGDSKIENETNRPVHIQ
jgi:exosortase/archaeosortase family protein